MTRVHVDTELRHLVERHVRYAGSELAAALLEVWDHALGEFWHVTPRANVATIEDEHEGTGGGAVQEGEEATAG
jgi:glutamate synthase domain-containing protein 3